ncbi:MAG TPA: hypothetical protein VFH70_05960 [Acidimicrobiales bacterium]|nr:hypothetical protein [Acidimicrobiales bacterium]
MTELGGRVGTVAYVARTWVPLVGPEVSRLLGFDDPDDPPRRLRLLADAYGLAEPADLLDTVLARQQAGLDGIRRRAEAGQTPYGRMWEKVRYAWPAQMRWMSENRFWLMSGF